MKTQSLILLVSMIAIVAGCASPPDRQRGAVETRLDEIQEAGLDQHLPELCAVAKDSFDAAVDEITRQEDASFFSRSYDRAERQLAFADSVLSVVADSVLRLSEALAQTIDSLREKATAMLDSATSVSVALEDDKANDPDYKSLRRRLVELTLQLGRANRAYGDESFIDAGRTYDIVIQGAEDVRRNLQALK